MVTFHIVFTFLLILSGLYLFDRAFNLAKCYMKSEQFKQKRYERLLTFLSVALLITSLFV